MIDCGCCQIILDDELVKFIDKDYEFVCYLFQNVGKLMFCVYLLEKVWGIMILIEFCIVDVYISCICCSLQICFEWGYCIKMVYQYGYCLELIDD